MHAIQHTSVFRSSYGHSAEKKLCHTELAHPHSAPPLLAPGGICRSAGRVRGGAVVPGGHTGGGTFAPALFFQRLMFFVCCCFTASTYRPILLLLSTCLRINPHHQSEHSKCMDLEPDFCSLAPLAKLYPTFKTVAPPQLG